MNAKSLILDIAAAGAIAAGVLSCSAYTSLMSALPMVGGSVPVVNTMSVPICRVTVFAASDPGLEYENERSGNIFLGPGEEGSVSYPQRKDDAGAPVSSADEKWNMKVYGCKKEAYTQKAAGELATIRDVDVRSQTPIAIR
jgi:hypothetical protein